MPLHAIHAFTCLPIAPLLTLSPLGGQERVWRDPLRPQQNSLGTKSTEVLTSVGPQLDTLTKMAFLKDLWWLMPTPKGMTSRLNPNRVRTVIILPATKIQLNFNKMPGQEII